MIEIKFRGIHIDSGSMVYGDLIRKTDFDGKQYFEIEQSIANDYHNWTVKPGTVGQFTGLKDSQDAEIYVNDIFDIGQTVNGQSKFVIVDCIGGYDVRYANDLSRKYEYDVNDLLSIEEIKKVGDISQNPELLET